MRSLFAVWLIALLSLSNLAVMDQPSAMCCPPQGTAIPFDGYWKLVSDTRQAIGQMEAKPAASVRQELDALASQWEKVTAVEAPDHNIINIDSSYLVAELRLDPPNIKQLGNKLDALLRAHEEYPQKVFTLDDVAPLKEILARPEFQWQQQQPLPMPDWLTKLFDRLIAFIDWVIAHVAMVIYGGSPLYKVAGALLFIFCLFFIARSLARNLVREAQVATDEEESDELLTSKGAFKRAETLSMQGDYRNAIRYLYLSSLLVLDEQGLMRYDRSRTNREYLRSVASKPELAKPLHDVIDVFDRVWYGFEKVDEQAYQSYVERVDELREKKE